MIIPECACGDANCRRRIVWEEGKRFVYSCGQLASTDAYLLQELETLNRKLDLVLRAQGYALVP